jgi:hypothetical protein
MPNPHIFKAILLQFSKNSAQVSIEDETDDDDMTADDFTTTGDDEEPSLELNDESDGDDDIDATISESDVRTIQDVVEHMMAGGRDDGGDYCSAHTLRGLKDDEIDLGLSSLSKVSYTTYFLRWEPTNNWPGSW